MALSFPELPFTFEGRQREGKVRLKTGEEDVVEEEAGSVHSPSPPTSSTSLAQLNTFLLSIRPEQPSAPSSLCDTACTLF